MAKITQDPDSFQDEVTIMQPEAILRFMLFKTADRQTYRPFGMSAWVDKATVLGSRYSYGKTLEFGFLDYSEESGSYVSALKPVLQRIPLPDQPDKSLLALTVFLATPELFEEMEQQMGTEPVEPPEELGEFTFPEQ